MDDLIQMVVRAERNRIVPADVVHTLAVRSLHDVDAGCSCGGWSMVATGYREYRHVEEEFQRHLLAVSGSVVSAPVPELPTIPGVLRDPCSSYWLRNALKSAIDRDCVDAVNDAEVLLVLLKARNEEIAKSFGPGVRF